MHFTNDGFPGGSFDRPGWKQMLNRIENGDMGTVIVKDMSRVRRDYLEYEGMYYTIGEGHKDFVAEKSMDEDNYILTLAAIARELRARGLSTAKIHLALGLPLKWMRTQREALQQKKGGSQQVY